MALIGMLGIGLVAGIVTGLIGASGVMVIVPGLTILGYSAADAIGASLFVDAIASLVVSWTYYKASNLNLKQGWWITVGSVIGAQIGSIVSPSIPDVGLGSSFGIFLFLTAAVFWMRGIKNSKLPNDEEALKSRGENKVLKLLRKNPIASSIGLGMLVGIVSGLLGAGGGVMILLILVFVLDYRMHEGVGTSTFIMAFTAASGAIGHAMTGNLPIKAALCSAAGTVIGGRMAAKYANKVNEATLSKVVGSVFCALGIMMLIGIQ